MKYCLRHMTDSLHYNKQFIDHHVMTSLQHKSTSTTSQVYSLWLRAPNHRSTPSGSQHHIVGLLSLNHSTVVCMCVAIMDLIHIYSTPNQINLSYTSYYSLCRTCCFYHCTLTNSYSLLVIYISLNIIIGYATTEPHGSTGGRITPHV